jgi:hypothetical protein
VRPGPSAALHGDARSQASIAASSWVGHGCGPRLSMTTFARARPALTSMSKMPPARRVREELNARELVLGTALALAYGQQTRCDPLGAGHMASSARPQPALRGGRAAGRGRRSPGAPTLSATPGRRLGAATTAGDLGGSWAGRPRPLPRAAARVVSYVHVSRHAWPIRGTAGDPIGNRPPITRVHDLAGETPGSGSAGNPIGGLDWKLQPRGGWRHRRRGGIRSRGVADRRRCCARSRPIHDERLIGLRPHLRQ